jgi:ketosteroid isomerase-like protein
MNQVVTGNFLRERTAASRGSIESNIRPIAAAAAAIERCLAQAHEVGDTEAVRLLHAVSAILTASPKA